MDDPLWHGFCQLLAAELGVADERLLPTTKLEEVANDSLDWALMVTSVEEFGRFELPVDLVEQLETVGDLFYYFQNAVRR